MSTAKPEQSHLDKKISFTSDADDDLPSDKQPPVALHGLDPGEDSKRDRRKSRLLGMLKGDTRGKTTRTTILMAAPPFHPKRTFPIDTLLNHLLKRAEDRLYDDNPKASAAKPPEVSTLAWIQINTVLYFNQVNIFFGALKDVCKCPTMSIRTKYEFMWADGKTIRKPISIPALDYVDYLMTWCEANLEDKRLFPDYDDAHHGREFMDTAKSIFKRLFRVFGHMETLHKDDLIANELGIAHERTLRCFIEFVKTFKLMDKKGLHPLHKEIDAWKAQGKL